MVSVRSWGTRLWAPPQLALIKIEKPRVNCPGIIVLVSLSNRPLLAPELLCPVTWTHLGYNERAALGKGCPYSTHLWLNRGLLSPGLLVCCQAHTHMRLNSNKKTSLESVGVTFSDARVVLKRILKWTRSNDVRPAITNAELLLIPKSGLQIVLKYAT